MIHLRQVNGVKKKKTQAFGVMNININKIYVLTMPSIQECVYH